MRSGGSLASTRGAFEVSAANWSYRMLHFTFGNCSLNSSVSALQIGNPVSKYAFRVTGAVPHVGAAAAADEGGADTVDAVVGDELAVLDPLA